MTTQHASSFVERTLPHSVVPDNDNYHTSVLSTVQVADGPPYAFGRCRSLQERRRSRTSRLTTFPEDLTFDHTPSGDWLMRAMMVGAAVVIGTLAAPLNAQGSHTAVDPKTRAELERARDVVWRAWFAGDSATLNRVLAGALAAGDDDGWADRKGAIDGSTQFAQGGGKLLDLKFDSTAIAMNGSVAVMTARYSYTTTDKAGKRNTTRGRAVEIFVLEKGAWMHPFWHLAR
jgi:hypothetical protein